MEPHWKMKKGLAGMVWEEQWDLQRTWYASNITTGIQLHETTELFGHGMFTSYVQKQADVTTNTTK